MPHNHCHHINLHSIKCQRFCRKFYTFEVLASESGSSPSLTGTATVNVEILDVNDNTPTFDSDNFSFMIYENQPIETAVGNVSASDRDSGTNAEVCC